MAKIEVVDYKDLSKKAQTIRSQGDNLKTNLQDVYKNVRDMHSCWFGKRYTELAKAFNKMKPSVDDMIKLVTAEIPNTLEKIAYNYSQADADGGLTRPTETTATKITEISEPTDTGMKFMAADVEVKKSAVEKCFENAVSKMNDIEGTFKSVQWNSEAADAFKSKFDTLKTKLIDEFDTLKTDFSQLMQQTIEDIQKAEDANTVQ